jgi:Bacteriophage T4-like portal protein (Gp20)
MRTNPEVKAVSYQRMANGYIKTTFSDGAELHVPQKGMSYGTVTDSGQITAFQPAVYIKPQGVIKRVQSAWSAFLGKPSPKVTTEQGASSASSPVTYYLTLWEQRFGRRARIEDTRSLYLTDPRVFRSVNMYVDEALRGGPQIRVLGHDRRSKRAQQIAKEVQRIYNPSLINEWGKGLVVEGDLFIQHVVSDDGEKKLVQAVAMPSIGMERLTNDADQFIEEGRAFEQIDSMTFETVAQFPSALMTHSRWSKINGDRYGTSEICTARRAIRSLELCEQAITISRLNRAPLRRHHRVGTPENTGSLQELTDYKAQNGFFSGKNEAYNPQSVLIDYFSNGNVTIETLQGDPYVGHIEDVRYLQNVLMSALPTPGPFFGLDIQDAKRDVLEDMRKLWVRSHTKIQLAMNEPILHGFELALTLAGIDPSLISYTIQWSMPSLETLPEIVDAVIAAKEGGGIAPRTAVQQLAPLMGVTDIDAELQEIEEFEDRKHEREVAKRSASITQQDKLDDEAPPKKRVPRLKERKLPPVAEE